MGIALLRLVFILCAIVVAILAIYNTLWFNSMQENHPQRSVEAFNVLVLWITAIFLVIKLVVM